MCDIWRVNRIGSAVPLLLFSICATLLSTSSATAKGMALEDIKNEGLACLDFADAMPILTNSIREFIDLLLLLSTSQHSPHFTLQQLNLISM